MPHNMILDVYICSISQRSKDLIAKASGAQHDGRAEHLLGASDLPRGDHLL